MTNLPPLPDFLMFTFVPPIMLTLMNKGAGIANNEVVETMLGLIAENLEKPLDADFLAREMMLSKSYVQNIFTQKMHIGLKKFIMQKKIYAAHAELSGGASPMDVCEKYAFGDYSVFYRLYRKTFGVSPRALQ